MPKQKQFPSAKKKQNSRKQKSKSPESANEYLAVGVDFEEAGEKWRAGDAAKSMRFFVRAIEDYGEGLRRFPHSFDLAYNKARLQYEVAQQPRLLTHLPTPLPDLLQLALDSHRVALEIDEDNADLLFNTAQVLTTLAEVISDGKHATQTNRDEALRLLHEALELFQRCLGIQEFQFTDQATSAAGESTENDDEFTRTVDGNTSESSEEERWASIVEPVTNNTLVDTVLAGLETLTAVCTLVTFQGGNDLSWVDEYYRNLLRNKIALYVDGTERHHEAALTVAKFICGFLDASFRSGQLDIPTYEREFAAAFKDIDLTNDPQGLCDKSDAAITFITSVHASLPENMHDRIQDLSQLNILSWKYLTAALDNLAAASKLPTVQNLARLHLRRGDCELLRYDLAEAPSSYDIAIKSADTLIKNAEVYYRGSGKMAKNEGAADEEREASVKEAVAAAIGGKGTHRLEELAKSHEAAVREVVTEMREEGLLSIPNWVLTNNSLPG